MGLLRPLAFIGSFVAACSGESGAPGPAGSTGDLSGPFITFEVPAEARVRRMGLVAALDEALEHLNVAKRAG